MGQPGMGQPGVGQPSGPPGFGPSPSLGQPAVTDADLAHADIAHAEPTHTDPSYAEPTHAGPTDAEPTHAGPAPHPGQDRPFEADGLAAVWASAVRGDPAPESLALLTQRTVPPVPPATDSGPAAGDRTPSASEPRSGAQPPGDSRPADAAPIRPPVTTPPRIPPAAADVPEIPPWDRKPLFVVIAASIVLVLIGILAGVVTAAVASAPVAQWRDAGSSTPEPGATPTSGESVAPPPEQETITLSGVGDVIMGSTNLGVPPNGGAGFFEPVRTALAADLVMGNLDMALSDPTGFGKCDPGATDCFQLSLPPSFASVLRDGGFGLMTLANNHTYDMGEQGYTNTRAALDAVGIEYTGGVDEITYVTVKGVEVAVLGFSVYSYTANLNNIPRAADLVRQATERADIVVVQMQGGAEGSDRTRVPPAGQHESFGGEDRGDLRGFAHAMVDAGADIVFGHGPHVMRGMEFYQGRLIAYSLGNFSGYAVLSSSGMSGVGGVLKVTLNRDGTWVSGELIATEMVGPGFPAVDTDLRALSFVDGLSVQDFGDSAARIDHQTGAITAP